MYKTFASAEFKKGPLEPSYKDQFKEIVKAFNIDPSLEMRKKVLYEYEYFTGITRGFLNVLTTDTRIWNDLWALRETPGLSYDVNDHHTIVSEKTFLEVYEWLYPELSEIQNLKFKYKLEERRWHRQEAEQKKQEAEQKKQEAEQKKQEDAAERARLIKRWKTILEGTWDVPWHMGQRKQDRSKPWQRLDRSKPGSFSYEYNKKLKLIWKNFVRKEKWWEDETDKELIDEKLIKIIKEMKLSCNYHVPILKKMPLEDSKRLDQRLPELTDEELIIILKKMPLENLKRIDNFLPAKTEDQLEEEKINDQTFVHNRIEAQSTYYTRKRWETGNTTPTDKLKREEKEKEEEEKERRWKAQERRSNPNVIQAKKDRENKREDAIKNDKFKTYKFDETLYENDIVKVGGYMGRLISIRVREDTMYEVTTFHDNQTFFVRRKALFRPIPEYANDIAYRDDNPDNPHTYDIDGRRRDSYDDSDWYDEETNRVRDAVTGEWTRHY